VRVMSIVLGLIVATVFGVGGSASGAAGPVLDKAPRTRPNPVQAAALPPAQRLVLRPQFDQRTGLAEPALAALVAASTRNDQLEVTRLAEKIGVARFSSILKTPDKSPDKAQVLAALDGVRAIDGGVRLLGVTARLLFDTDARVVERAALTVGELLRADQLDKMLEWEVTTSEVLTACGGLSRAAESSSSALPARVAALEALGEAYIYCKISFSLAGLGADVWPEVRRAALLAPQMMRSESIDAIGALIEDAVPLVAGAAGAVWCRAQYDSLRKNADNDLAKQRLFKLRLLVLADVAPPEDTTEILPCLSLSKDAEDQKVVELARKRQKEMPTPSPATIQSTMPRW
jgi:hypothetical protein